MNKEDSSQSTASVPRSVNAIVVAAAVVVVIVIVAVVVAAAVVAAVVVVVVVVVSNYIKGSPSGSKDASGSLDMI